MVRDVLGEMLHLESLDDVLNREPVDGPRYQLFLQDPSGNGPKIHSTRLDTDGNTTKELMETLWNQAFIHKLAQEIEFIAKQCTDPHRFGKTDWMKLAHDRVYAVLKMIAEAKPKGTEDKLAAFERMARIHRTRLLNARNAGSRHFVQSQHSVLTLSDLAFV